MTEEAELEGGEASEGPEPASAAAVAIALGGRLSPGATAVDTEAAAFLRDQRRLINLQAEHLHEQRDLQLAHLRVRRWKDRMSLSLRVRGQIVTVKHDWPTAERWFKEATRQAPSLPFAFTDWGVERLTHGDTDGAIAVLQRAHEVGPRFAEPLELTGEALMRKGDYRSAITKFRLADESAPLWGGQSLALG
jgi:tetratricopeptide (TPR) repeat protein